MGHIGLVLLDNSHWDKWMKTDACCAGVDWTGVMRPVEAGGVRILLDLSKKVREALYSRVGETRCAR